MTASLLLRNVRPMGEAIADMLIEDGRIRAVGAALRAPAGTPVEDGGGRLALPGLVDAHTHLDKSLLGMAWYRNEVGPTLIDRIENERRAKAELGIEPERQALRQAIASVACGTSHIRSHVDVDTLYGLAGVEGVMRAREALRGIVDIELVAFPQSGLLLRAGTEALMARALDMGVEVIGGIDPCGMDRDPKGHLDVLFGLAERHGRPLDIHLHETGELGAFSMDLILERTRVLGMQGRVAISHAFCLGSTEPALAERLIAGLADLRIHILTSGLPSRPTPPVARLRQAGIAVGGGNDGFRDTWGPYGNADMLERAMMIGLRNNFRRDDEVEMALDVCTHGGARVLGLEDYGLRPGCRADFCLSEGRTLAEAVVLHAPRALVVKGGRVVARAGRALTEAP